MEVLLVVYYTDNHAQLAEATNPNKIAYCNYWNKKGKHYTFFPWIGWFGELPPGLSVIPMMQYLLTNTHYDLIFFVNTDTYIMNFTVTMESLIDDEHSLFITRDVNGLNGGVFLLKNDANGKKFINFMNRQITQNLHNSEQYAIQRYCYLDTWKPVVKIIPQRKINAYFDDLYYGIYGGSARFEEKANYGDPGNFEKGDFLVHWPGLGVDHRIELSKSDRVQKNIIYPPDFNDPIEIPSERIVGSTELQTPKQAPKFLI